MVRATHLTPESIVKAIDRGDFYASSGVVLNSIHYDSAKKTYSIEIDAQPGETYTTEFIGTVIDYDATSRPVLDADQQPIRATRRYSGDVGKTLAVVKGDSATYRLTGDELYVRATITSSAKAENPFESGQRQQAWAQPVGWRKHVK